jgi:hypothetical protein
MPRLYVLLNMTVDWNKEFNALRPEELDKLALLRVIECSNGVIQHSFRDNLDHALSVEETRRAMKYSMGAIKSMTIQLDGEPLIHFAKETARLMGAVRDLYLSGVKRNNDEDFARFLVASLACLKACGLERLEAAKIKLYNSCYELPSHTYDWGLDYIYGLMASETLLE